MVSLETESLFLRMLQPRDLDACAERRVGPEVMRYISERRTFSGAITRTASRGEV